MQSLHVLYYAKSPHLRKVSTYLLCKVSIYMQSLHVLYCVKSPPICKVSMLIYIQLSKRLSYNPHALHTTLEAPYIQPSKRLTYNRLIYKVKYLSKLLKYNIKFPHKIKDSVQVVICITIQNHYYFYILLLSSTIFRIFFAIISYHIAVSLPTVNNRS